jgi:hypothetical protein
MPKVLTFDERGALPDQNLVKGETADANLPYPLYLQL